MARHEFTKEERSRGSLARAAKLREQRDQRQRETAERFDAMLDKAFLRLEQLLESPDDATAARAIREVFDRSLGRPVQALAHGGHVEFHSDVEGARAKLEALISRRSAQIASESSGEG